MVIPWYSVVPKLLPRCIPPSAEESWLDISLGVWVKVESVGTVLFLLLVWVLQIVLASSVVCSMQVVVQYYYSLSLIHI